MTVTQLRRFVLRTPGATWEQTRNGHYTVRVNGVRVCTIPKTASDSRSIQNCISQLRRAGVDIPRK